MQNPGRTHNFVFGVLALIACNAIAANPFGIQIPELDDWDNVVHEDSKAAFVFKNAYSGFFFQGLNNYDNPKLGYSLSYASVPGTSITIYVYDNGIESIPDGTTSQLVIEQLNTANQSLTQSGRYLSVVEEARPDLSSRFLQTFHMIKLKNGVEIRSYTLLRAQNQRFVKIRVTGQSGLVEPRVSTFLHYIETGLGIQEQYQLGGAGRERA